MGVVQNKIEIVRLKNKPSGGKLYLHLISMDGSLENVNSVRRFIVYSTQEDSFTKETLHNYLYKPNFKITLNLRNSGRTIISGLGASEGPEGKTFRYDLISLDGTVFSNQTVSVLLTSVGTFKDTVYEI